MQNLCSLRTCPDQAAFMPRIVLFGRHAETGLEVPAESEPISTLAMCGDCRKQFHTVDDLLGEGHLAKIGQEFLAKGKAAPFRSELRWVALH